VLQIMKYAKRLTLCVEAHIQAFDFAFVQDTSNHIVHRNTVHMNISVIVR
jgi:hypothetical protein